MTPDSAPSLLSKLAAAHGVGTIGPAGAAVPEESVRLVLEALGVPASTDGEVRLSLETHHAQWRPLPSVVAARAGRSQRVPGWVPEGFEPSAFVTTAGGRERAARVEVSAGRGRITGGDRVVRVTVVVPGDLPVGQHLLTLDFEWSGVSVPLFVAPQVFPALSRPGVRWGLGGATHEIPTSGPGKGSEVANTPGSPDLADLAELVSWVGADLDGDFVLWDPASAGGGPYADPLWVRPAQVPEHAGLDESGRAVVASGPRREALRALYAVPRSPRRQRAFESFCVAGGQPLLDHATWLAITARYGPDPQRWEPALRDAGSEEVARLREAEAVDVNFHRWCQWVADEQLAEAAREATRSGMGLGLVAALHAPGAVPGSEAWAHGSLPVEGVRVGRPPGPRSVHGEVGEAAPWSPAVLRDLGFAPLTRRLEVVSRHAAGMVLRRPEEWFRQWWVPEGLPAGAGTWVAQDSEALLAAVGIAAHRHGTVVMLDAEGDGLAAPETQWLVGQGVLPLVDGSAGAMPAEGQSTAVQPLRWVDVAELANGEALSVRSLAASPGARRRARRLTR